MLQKYGGIENFKRTVSHNYYNWLVTKEGDYQLTRVQELSDSENYKTDRIEDLFGPLHDRKYAEVYKKFVSLVWDYTLTVDKRKFLDRIKEPLIGNPVKIWRGDLLLSQDLAHTARECNLLLDYTEPGIVGELGAGHGRIAHVLPAKQYLIFDIAPALAISQWYIERLFPGEKIFRFRPFNDFSEIEEELSQCRFGFFAANQIEKFPRMFDLFINVCSLMEMNRNTVEYYMREIERVTKGFFYTKQWHVRSRIPDGMTCKSDYPTFGKIVVDRIDAVNVKLFEQIWQAD